MLKLSITEFSEKEKNYYKHMSSLIRDLASKYLTLSLNAHEERSVILFNFLETVQGVGIPVKLDVLFILTVLRASAQILESYDLDAKIRDAFIFDLFEACTQTLPDVCKEEFYYPPVFLTCFQSMQKIAQLASPELKSLQSYHDYQTKLFNYIISSAREGVTSNPSHMAIAIKTHQSAVNYVTGSLLNPEQSASFYFDLYLQSYLDLAHIPYNIQESKAFQALLNAKIAKDIEKNTYGVVLGMGLIGIGVLLLTQMIPMTAVFSTLIGSISSIIGIGLFAYYMHEAMVQNDSCPIAKMAC